MIRRIAEFIFLLVFVIPITVFAGPTIIRDNRIHDLAMTPVLGRGYSIATNSFQSSCMKDIKMTEPSYDFDYTFDSIETDSSSTTSNTFGLGVDLGHLAFQGKLNTKYTSVNGTTLYYHHIKVEINMHTYYASVDESASALSDAAKTLLLNRDIPGFFQGCGSYYVRSLGRDAKFVSIFTYMDESQTKDTSFELQLELAIKGFGGGILKSIAGVDESAGLESQITNSFTSMSRKKKLTITTKAWGLGKNKNATLIAYDLDSYKAAIKDAFISMQDPMTGRVSTMEVVPWVENAEFQNLIRLEDDVNQAGGEKLLLFEKKNNLNINAEFLSQIDRTNRNMMDIYYKAMICRQTIDSRWKRDNKFLPEVSGALVQNNKNENTITLEDLYNQLSDDKLNALLTAENEFLYGLDGKNGARECMNQMMREGIHKKSWKEIDACKRMGKNLITNVNEIIDDYCMPKLSKSSK
ncbi:MAG TPA: hypothetical protein PLY36_07725 [Spirochaetota bacterium]|nr:hypothetical protein [Spirochaetota bacterium]